ncbi:hypothetical protein CDL15_Pgr010545 [Punica granatum]|uniref:Uncharacterized protein n=1 Tax=Punica granatum TaxID=22663 RepID=A0A218XWU9_PUNGR|nr:hypothetical protein CDL15_Pgr010545 [Punica granatum]
MRQINGKNMACSNEFWSPIESVKKRLSIGIAALPGLPSHLEAFTSEPDHDLALNISILHVHLKVVNQPLDGSRPVRLHSPDIVAA